MYYYYYERNADVLLNTCKDIGLAVNTGKTKNMEAGCNSGMMANEHIMVILPVLLYGCKI